MINLGIIATIAAAVTTGTVMVKAPGAPSSHSAIILVAEPSPPPPVTTPPINRDGSLLSPDGAKAEAGLKSNADLRPQTLPAGSNTLNVAEVKARARAEAQGYKDVQRMEKDAGGIWHGIAVKNGETVNITVEATGEVKSHSR